MWEICDENKNKYHPFFQFWNVASGELASCLKMGWYTTFAMYDEYLAPKDCVNKVFY